MLSALFGLALGLAIGAVLVGLAAGARLGKSADVSRLDISVDMDEAVPVPNLGGKPVPESSRRFLDYAPLWAKWPDYDRVLFMNTILTTLWPYYNAAVGKIAVKEAAAPLAEVCKKVPGGLLQAIDIEALDLGTKPLAVGGIKAYTTKDDSCVFEAPIQWGSDMRVRIGVRLKFGPFVVHLPLEVAGVQVRAVARIALRPLVEELPCLGGAEVSLLEPPYYDLTLRLGTAIDLMRLPGVKPAVDAVVRKVVADMLLYPNKFAVELMPGGGLPPPPLGMVEVRIDSVTDINGGGSLLTSVDPFVEVQCRKGRVTRTRTVWNTTSPVFDETISAIVDDPENQSLNLRLVDDKGGINDKVIGELHLPLMGAEFFRNPRTPVRLVLPFEKPAAAEEEEEEEAGDAKSKVGEDGAVASPSKKAPKESLRERVRRQRRAKQNRPEVGLLTCTARYLPFKVDPAQLERMRRAKEARLAKAKAEADAAVEEATKELAEAQAAVDSAAAGSKREVDELAAAKGRLQRAVSRAAGAGVDKAGVAAAAAAELGTAAATSSTGEAPATTVADARQEVAEAEEATEDAVAAAAAAADAAAGRDKAAAAEAAGKAAAASKPAPAPAPATFLEGPLTDETKGILTLTLVKARNLAATGQVDPFVELSLLDPAVGVPQKQWSATWNNEPNPRWGEKFDFVNVSATSVLTINVWDKKGLLEAAFAAIRGRTLQRDRVMTEKIGSLRLRVEEVARNRRIKDEWALQETQKGDITLALEWFPVEVDGDVGSGDGGVGAAAAAAAAAAAVPQAAAGLAGL